MNAYIVGHSAIGFGGTSEVSGIDTFGIGIITQIQITPMFKTWDIIVIEGKTNTNYSTYTFLQDIPNWEGTEIDDQGFVIVF